MEAELLQLKTDMDSLKEKESGLHNEIDSLKKNTEKLSKE